MPASYVELAPEAAARLLHAELAGASAALHAAAWDTALDRYTRGLGMALQLGPAAVESALRVVLEAVRCWVARQELELEGMPDNWPAALGPALVEVIGQVREAGALPHSAVMEAWSGVSHDIAALLGQWGVALSLPKASREGIMGLVLARAGRLDEVTGSRFSLTVLVDSSSL